MIELNAFVGAEFDGRLRLEDSNGNRIQNVDYDPAPIAGAANFIAVRLHVQ